MNQTQFPRISFGIIVVNGEPFTRYCLRSLYPFAYEIIVVEGGHENTRSVCTADGHSMDNTLETLWRFKKEEDPENKLQIVTRNGFWPAKDEMGNDRTHQSRAYAERATGDYLWQVDIDEFYRPEEMRRIIKLLQEHPDITAMSFKSHTFWGSPAYVADGWPLRRGGSIFHRLFRWGEGFRYVTHEPPTVHDKDGKDMRKLIWIGGNTLARRGIFLYHYSLLLPVQVKQKTQLYLEEKTAECGGIVKWADNNYFKLNDPYRVHNLYSYPSWLERFTGKHPPEVLRMMDDIGSGRINCNLRRTDDIERLLASWWYPLGRTKFKVFDILDRFRSHFLRVKNIPRRFINMAHQEKAH